MGWDKPQMSHHEGSVSDDRLADHFAILNAMPFAALLTDSDGKIIIHNDSAAYIIHSDAAFNGVFPDILNDETKAAYVNLTLNGSPAQLNVVLKNEKGRKSHFINIAPVYLGGKLYRLITFNGLSATKNKADMADSSLVRRALADIPGSAIYIIDTGYKYLLAEGDWTVIPKEKQKGMEGRFVYDVLDKQSLEILLPVTEKIFNQQQTNISKEIYWQGLYFLLRATALNNDNNEIFGAVITVIDVSHLKNVQMQLSKLNDSLERKVITRTAELTAANNDLESFSYSVSHDLRTPLRAMNGYSKMMKEMYGTTLDANGNRLLDNIIQNADNMGRLIDDLLAFARISRKDINHKQVNMMNMVNDCARELLPDDSDQVLIDISYLPVCSADPAMIKQVWLNLISNAIKYSSKEEKTQITVGSKKLPKEYVFFVKDNGVGFDMQYYDKLFGVFQRLHGQNEFEGTGIGLALVKRIIEKHNGHIWAESAPGQGATFYFSLPQLF